MVTLSERYHDDPVLTVLRASRDVTPGTTAYFVLQAHFGGSPRRPVATAFSIGVELSSGPCEKIIQLGGTGEGWFTTVVPNDSAGWQWGHFSNLYHLRIAPSTVLPPIGITVQVAAHRSLQSVALSFFAYASPAGSATAFLSVPIRR